MKPPLWVSNLKRCQLQACQSYSALRFHEGVGTSLSGGRLGLPGPGQCSSLKEQQKKRESQHSKPWQTLNSDLTHLPKRQAGPEHCFILLLLMYSERNKKGTGFPHCKSVEVYCRVFTLWFISVWSANQRKHYFAINSTAANCCYSIKIHF